MLSLHHNNNTNTSHDHSGLKADEHRGVKHTKNKYLLLGHSIFRDSTCMNVCRLPIYDTHTYKHPHGVCVWCVCARARM